MFDLAMRLLPGPPSQERFGYLLLGLANTTVSQEVSGRLGILEALDFTRVVKEVFICSCNDVHGFLLYPIGVQCSALLFLG